MAAGDTAAVDTTYPAASRGVLVARTARPGALSGSWRPTAGICRHPPSLQLLARGDSVDVLIVLRLAADGAAIGDYPVALPDSATGVRAALVGVQRLRYVDVAYQGARGVVRVERLDRVVSGRFDVVLAEVVSHEKQRYLGVFDGVRLDTLPDRLCPTAGSR